MWRVVFLGMCGVVFADPVDRPVPRPRPHLPHPRIHHPLHHPHLHHHRLHHHHHLRHHHHHPGSNPESNPGSNPGSSPEGSPSPGTEPYSYPAAQPGTQPGTQGQAQGISHVIRETELSMCYSLPELDPARDVAQRVDWYRIRLGYQIWRDVLILVVDGSGTKVYEKVVAKQEMKYASFESRSFERSFLSLKTLEERQAAARAEVIRAYQDWVSSIRHFECAYGPPIEPVVAPGEKRP